MKNKIRIMFVCHGNICRSPMAEAVMSDMVEKLNMSEKFEIASSATSTEEIGSGVHRGTLKKLAQMNIPIKPRQAVQLRYDDYDKYDYFLGMDSQNIRNMLNILGQDPQNKISRLLDYSENARDIADPWYTGNFDITYDDIVEGCTALLRAI